MKEIIVASGPLVGKSSNSLAYRVVLTAYYNGDKLVKYATHRQTMDTDTDSGKVIFSKSDGKYFESFNSVNEFVLRADALANFLWRVAKDVTMNEEIATLSELLLVQAVDS